MTDLDELIAEARESFSDATSGGDFDDWETLGRIVPRLADALEATTRVPVQGELNDDREALDEKWFSEWEKHQSMGDRYGGYHAGFAAALVYCRDGLRASSLSRATVPDAATEGRLTQAELEDIAETHAFCADRLLIETELVEELEAELEKVKAAAKLSHGFLEIEKEEHAETRAERDATEVRIERWMQLVGKAVEERMAAEAERDAALAAVERVRAVVKSIRFLAALPPFDEGNTVMNAAADDIVAALDGKEKNDE